MEATVRVWLNDELKNAIWTAGPFWAVNIFMTTSGGRIRAFLLAAIGMTEDAVAIVGPPHFAAGAFAYWSLREKLQQFLSTLSRTAHSDPMRQLEFDLDPNRRHLRHLRSEEHTSELQSLRHLVCRLLLEKK